jgi:hypothetical protein
MTVSVLRRQLAPSRANNCLSINTSIWPFTVSERDYEPGNNLGEHSASIEAQKLLGRENAIGWKCDSPV